MNSKKELLRMIKFTLFSISAGVIQGVSFALLTLLNVEPTWSHLIALVLSVLWNFTLNRRYTFQSATNIPIAMLKIACFYLVFTPLSTWFISFSTNSGLNSFIAEGIAMLSNFVLEFLFCKFLVYKGTEDTLEK